MPHRNSKNLDQGLFEFSLSGSNGIFTFVDDSLADSVSGNITKRSAYNIVSGSLETPSSSSVTYNPQGLGMFYPSLGIVVLNASKMDELLYTRSDTDIPDYNNSFIGQDGGIDYALNHLNYMIL